MNYPAEGKNILQIRNLTTSLRWAYSLEDPYSFYMYVTCMKK